jgi:caffeoyl-CoA O-methyltransferase
MASTPDTPFVTPDIHAYAVSRSAGPDAIQRDLIAETAALGPRAVMQIDPYQGAFMELLVRVSGARRAVEVGTFTGYSALCIARALPDDGTLLCCDVSEEWTQIARRYWARAGVARKIELRLAPALATLRALPAHEPIDLAFIDADKANYGAYYDELLPRLRPGGLLLVDNTLWYGRVLDAGVRDEDTAAIRAFNDRAAADPRVECVLLPIGDGLTLLRKR